jgi:hypothetical protein
MREQDVTFYSGGYTLAGTFTEAASPARGRSVVAGRDALDREHRAVDNLLDGRHQAVPGKGS